MAPIGYKNGLDAAGRKTLLHHPERAPFIRRAFELYAAGLHTKEEIRRKLNGEGFKTRAGKPVSGEIFHNALKNPLYAGLIEKKIWGMSQKASFEPIISEELFDRVQAVLKGKAHKATPHERNNPDFPLRHFTRCADCEKPLTASFSKGRSARYPYYHCRNNACLAVNAKKEKFEQEFMDFLEALHQPGYTKLQKAIMLDAWRERQADSGKHAKKSEDKLAALEGRKARLQEAFIYEREIDRETYHAELAKLAGQTALARQEVAAVRADELDVAGLLNYAEQIVLKAPRFWQEIPPPHKVRFQKVLFPSGLRYSEKTGFGTDETCLLLKPPGQNGGGNSGVVPPAGVEPTSG